MYGFDRRLLVVAVAVVVVVLVVASKCGVAMSRLGPTGAFGCGKWCAHISGPFREPRARPRPVRRASAVDRHNNKSTARQTMYCEEWCLSCLVVVAVSYHAVGQRGLGIANSTAMSTMRMMGSPCWYGW